jgi:copper chaperone
MERKTFNVNGMACSHCKANVERALKAIDGVSSAEADVEQKSVVVEFDASRVSFQTMKTAVEEAGYEMPD